MFRRQPTVLSLKIFRDPPNLFFRDPDVSRLTATAIAALRTAEIQSCRIPFRFRQFAALA